MDFVQGLDPSKLSLALTALSFFLSPFASPPYNLPVMLFGTLVQQQEAGVGQALHIVSHCTQLSLDLASTLAVHRSVVAAICLVRDAIPYTALLGASIPFDIIWMIGNSQNGFIRFLSLLLVLLKLPAFISFGLALRQRGGGLGFGSLNIRGNDLGGATVWDSMPGGFGSVGNNGYQNFDDERPAQYSRPTAPAPAAAQTTPPPQAAQPAAQPYQTV
ncbi:unnamed protein product [Mycena citricolor]|uniref:Uncharacterized protein n=1 Tax=Mycena citricolor TaxID=2018698 RepID=A0AAD2GXU0_9AGAR|nr:unnamed protein product [Mycena citricolor]